MEQRVLEQPAQDALSKIVELSDEVRAYQESMDGLAAEWEARWRKTAAIISELEKVMDEQERRLQQAIDHYGVQDIALHNKTVASFRFMHGMKKKLHELSVRSGAQAGVGLPDRVVEAVEAARDQIAYALDIRFAE